MKFLLVLASLVSLSLEIGCSKVDDVLPKTLKTGSLGLDETFGGGGILRSPGAGNVQPLAAEMFVEPGTGKIHVATAGGNSLFFLTYGANGESPDNAPSVYIPALSGYLFDRDGKVLTLVSKSRTTTTVTRYTNDGIVDSTFGTAGGITLDFEVTGIDCPIGQSTILLAGSRISSPDIIVARMKPDGSADTTFGTAGRITVSSAAWGNGVANFLSQSDGKFLVSDGSSLVRYSADGQSDPTFQSLALPRPDAYYGSARGFQSLREHAGQLYFYDDDSGHAISFLADGSRQDKQFSFSKSQIQSASMLVTATGKVWVGGTCNDPEDGWRAETDMCVFRANESGSVDADFGRSGELFIAASDTGYDRLVALTEQPDGKVLAFGVTQNEPGTRVVGEDWHFVLIRIK